MKGRVIDFYSGLGGASEAFVQDGRYQVSRIDNNMDLKHVEYTNIANILNLSVDNIEFLFGDADLMIFGPPCYEFSLAHSAPQGIAARENKLESYAPDMSHLHKIMEIIDYCKPKYWIIENVAGSLRHFEPVLGEFTQKIGPFFLWHNLPALSMLNNDLCEIVGHKTKSDPGPSQVLRSNYRAKWPLVMSKALLKSFETPTLEDFI